MDDGKCICCEKEIFEEQDYTTLICHAAGQTISHMTLAHDKCWEKFKKSFVRGRGTSSRTQTFFCPVAGCHNALQHQHLSVRKKTHGSGSAGPTAPKKADGLSTGADVADSYTALPGLDGAPRLPSKQGEPPRPPRSVCRESLTMCALVCNIVGGANRLSRHEADAEEVTRCVRSMVSTSRDRPSSASPGHTPRPHSKLAVPCLIRSSKRRTTGARRSRLMEHAAAGLHKMLSLGHAGFTLTLFDGSASLPKKQLKRQWSVNDRSVPPRSRLFIMLHAFSSVSAHGRSSWSWPPLEKE